MSEEAGTRAGTSAVLDNDSTGISTSNHFWDLLRAEYKSPIPDYIVNILKFNHMDTPRVFTKITQDVIKELEESARSLVDIMMNETSDLKLFYGPFHKTPKLFRFLPGDKMLINELVQLIQNKPIDFWEPKTQEINLSKNNSCSVRKVQDNSSNVTKIQHNSSKVDIEGQRKILSQMIQFFSKTRRKQI